MRVKFYFLFVERIAPKMQTVVNHKLLLFAIILLFSTNAFGQKQNNCNPKPLPQSSLEKQFSSSEIHCYQFDLKKGQFIQIKVEQKGIDVVLQIIDLKRNKLAENDDSGKEETEIISFIADQPGKFVLEIKSADEENNLQRVDGSYIIKVKTTGASTESDRKQILVERERQTARNNIKRLVDEAVKLKNKIRSSISTEPFEQSLEKADEALKIAESLESSEYKAYCLFLIGTIYEAKEDAEKATEFYRKTAELSQTISVKNSEFRETYIHALKNLGRTYFFDGRYEDSLKYLFQGLNLYKENEEDKNKGIIIRFIADCYNNLGDYSNAEKYYKAAQNIFQRTNLPLEEGTLLTKWGQIYLKQNNQLTIALAKFLEAEKLLENCLPKTDSCDRKVFNLINISWIYGDLKDTEKSYLYQEKAAKVIENVNDYLIVTGNFIIQAGNLYGEGKYEEAKKECERVLELADKYKFTDPVSMKINAYQLLISIFIELKEYKKVSETLENWFALVKDSSNKSHLALFYKTYGDLIEVEKSVQAYKTGINLILSQKDKDKDLLAEMVDALAVSLLRLKQVKEASELFKDSLTIRMANNSTIKLSNYLSRLMSANNFIGNRELAIFFGKMSVIYKQEFRKSLNKFPIQDQRLFLSGNRKTFEDLINILFRENRLVEAQQVINLFQDQEFYDFSKTNFESSGKITSDLEEKYANDFQKLQSEIEDIMKAISKIEYKASKRDLKAEEKQLLDELETKRQQTYDLIKKLLEDIDVDFKQSSEKVKVEKVKDTSNMLESLSLLDQNSDGKKHATIYTLITQDTLNILLIVPEKDPQGNYLPYKAFTYPIKTIDLNNKIRRFLDTLKNRSSDPYDTGYEIYKTIFQSVSIEDKKTTLEEELSKYKINVLHWSLDGNLRYIPVAALSDGKKQFVVEKYETAVFTRAEKQSFVRQPQKWNSCLGLGTTKAYPDFNELKGVAREAGSFCNPKSEIIKGNFFLNEQFNPQKMESLNSESKPPLIHLSTHFKFLPGDAQSSFLLLGEGTHFSLYDMQKYPNLFQDVDLLMAAACETAGFQADSNGKEIDAFAELAQRLGAKSVIATLWKVNDAGTSQFMIDFYRSYNERAKKNADALPAKSEILREAQLNFLKQAKENKNRCLDETNKSPRPSDDPPVPDSVEKIKPFSGNPCEHPYFWAPFVLYGSSR